MKRRPTSSFKPGLKSRPFASLRAAFQVGLTLLIAWKPGLYLKRTLLMLAINLFAPVARLAKRLFVEEVATPANHYVAPRVSAPLPPPDARVARVSPPRVNLGEPFHSPAIVEHTTRSLGREHQE